MKLLSPSSAGEIQSFIEDYCEFGDKRVYILVAMARPRENEQITHNNMPIFRELLTEAGDIQRKFNKLKAITENYTPEEGGDLSFRFYLTANARSIEKAFFNYQKMLTQMSYNITTGHDDTWSRIKRLDKEWVSTLQSDDNKEDKRFIIDIDTLEEDRLREIYNHLDEITTIITATRTENGFHIITDPFNPEELTENTSMDDVDLKTDGLIFLNLFN